MARFAPEVDRIRLSRRLRSRGSRNFDRFRAGSALWAAAGDPFEVRRGGEIKLTLFGHQPCQSTMCLCEDVLKGKCRSEPNVNPARADRDHGTNLEQSLPDRAGSRMSQFGALQAQSAQSLEEQ